MTGSNDTHQPSGPNPRSVRDGAVAAAIGAALAMALESSTPLRLHPAGPVETPWVMSSRERMSTVRHGWQPWDKWGVLSGWKGTPGGLRNKIG